MRQLNIGCFGGGTGLPSLLAGLKNNPWLDVHAIVTNLPRAGAHVPRVTVGGDECHAGLVELHAFRPFPADAMQTYGQSCHP